MSNPMNVLVLCTGNSARSIMAEALINHLGGSRFKAFSAGSKPTGKVNPLALRVLDEQEIDASAARSKSWEEFAGNDAPQMGLVITVCDDAAAEPCPVWPGAPAQVHWGLPDPAAVEGSDMRKLRAFRNLFTQLEDRVTRLVALTDSLDDVERLEIAVRRIHNEL